VQGSLEPIINSLKDLNKEGGIKINVLYGETGNITENDIYLAAASKAIVLGFNVQADISARRLAESEGVSIRLYDIIYRLIEDIEKALKGMLEPEFKEVFLGYASVLAVFKISKVGAIAAAVSLKEKSVVMVKSELNAVQIFYMKGKFPLLSMKKTTFAKFARVLNAVFPLKISTLSKPEIWLNVTL